MPAIDFHAGLDACLPVLQGFGFDERWPPGRRWWIGNRHRPDNGFAIFQWLEAGRAVLRDAQGDHEIGPGQAFLFVYGEDSSYGRPPDRPEWSGHREALLTHHVVLRGPGLGRIWELLRQRAGPVLGLPHPEDFLARIRLHRERFIRDLDRDRWVRAQHALDLLRLLAETIEAGRSAGSQPAALAVEALLRDPLGPGGIKDLARRHGCSREHLCRVFARRMGVAPSAWLGRIRRERAFDLLRSTDLSLDTIAQRCGAGTAHTLARWVREATGQGPRALRAGRDRRV
jgi:AraC-like DNA-binding protein